MKLEIRANERGLVKSIGIIAATLSSLFFVMTVFSGYAVAPSKELPGGYVIEYNLIENTDQCLVDCYLRFNFSLNKDYTITDASKFKAKFVKAPGALDLRDWGLRIRQNKSYEVDIPEYSTCVEYVYYEPPNSTCTELGYDDWNETCCQYEHICQTGTHTEERWRWVWNDFNPVGKTIVGGKWYTIELWGKKRPKLGENNIDAIPVILDHELPYDWWESDWKNRKNMTIIADSTTHTNDYLQVNVSGIKLATNNCTKELRLSDSGGTAEQDFIIIDDSGQSLGDGNEWCIIGFNATIPANTDTTFSVYYNNPDATPPSYMDEEIGFGEPTINFMGMYIKPEDEGWTHTGSSGTWSNMSLPDRSNRWHLKFSAGGSADYYYRTDANILNYTWIFRLNTTSTQPYDILFRVGPGSSAATDYYEFLELYNDLWRLGWSMETTIGSSDLSVHQTYRMIYDNSNNTVTAFVYNQTDGNATVIGSSAVTPELPVDDFYFGDSSSGGDGNPVTYYDFIGFQPANAYPPLLYTSGDEESVGVVVDQKINNINCDGYECVLYQSDESELNIEVTSQGNTVNATNINATIYLNTSSGWTEYQFIGNSSFVRTGDGMHEANFTVNNTLGRYKVVANVTYSGSETDTDYFNVSHAWWDKAWKYRKMINITETSGTNIPFGINISFGDDKVLNCSREIIIVNYTWDNQETTKPINISIISQVYTETYTSNNKYCVEAYISWIFNASDANQTYFIYYGNPIADKPDDRIIKFDFMIGGMEESTKISYDSHLDFVWWGANFTGVYSDNWNQSALSKYRRNNTNKTYNSIVNLGYKPRVSSNRRKQLILDSMIYDEFYWFNGHGTIFANETWFNPPITSISSSDISDLSDLSAKFVEIASCYSGENNQTDSPLTSWFGKSFIEKNVDCFLGFQDLLIEVYTDPETGQVITTPFPDFNNCFWDNVTSGGTIRNAVYECDIYGGVDVAPKLYNSTIEMTDGCNQNMR